jgi:hypothetical protein
MHSWHEAIINKNVNQSFDFWPAQGNNVPLAIYFHPNGVSSHVRSNSDPSSVYQQIVQTGKINGYSVASIEFRHPVVNANLANDPMQDLNGHVPQNDIVDAVRYIKSIASTLRINPNRIFYIGHSRGSLSMWQALQPDVAGVPRAMWEYQAQSTNQCDQWQSHYEKGVNGVFQSQAICESSNPLYFQWQSAWSSVTSAAPPLHLGYQQSFVLQPSGAIKKLTWTELTNPTNPPPSGWELEHYPNMGADMCIAYAASATPGTPCVKTENVPAEQAFNGWTSFFLPYR